MADDVLHHKATKTTKILMEVSFCRLGVSMVQPIYERMSELVRCVRHTISRFIIPDLLPSVL